MRTAKINSQVFDWPRRGVCRRRAGTLLALAALMLVLPAGAAAERPPQQWQAAADELAGSGAGQVDLPRGIGVDQVTGHLFVTELLNNRIGEFNAHGEFIRAWGWDVSPDGAAGDTASDQFEVCTETCKAGVVGPGAGQFDIPQGVAVSPDGAVFVYDRANRRVQKFSSAGEFLWMAGNGVNQGPGSPGNLCTATHLEEGDACGAGASGTGPSEFSLFTSYDSIEVGAEGHLFAGDVGRIQEFDQSGAYLGEVGGDTLNPEEIVEGSPKVVPRTVQALAVDGDGEFYVTLAGKDDVHKLNGAGEPGSPATFPVESPSSVAVTSTREVYAVEDPFGNAPGLEKRILQFDAAGAVLIPSPAERAEIAKLKLEGKAFEYFGEASEFGSLNGLATSAACGLSPDELYVSRYNSDFNESHIRAYGPAPDLGLCPSGAQGPPEVTAQYATSVRVDSALVGADINPHQVPGTTYQVEYGTGKCAEGGCPSQLPLDPATLPQAGALPLATQKVFLPGLAPGTAYRYRFVARSEAGGPVHGIAPEGGEASFAAGLEGTFITPALPVPLPSPDPCPNAQFRTGLSALLPDCRAYELVSPLDKDNGDVFTLSNSLNERAELNQGAPDGEKLTYSTYRAYGDAESAPFTSQYLASRTASGWQSDAISPPRGISILGNGSFETEYQAFTPDLCMGWILHDTDPLLAPGAVDGFPNVYRTDLCNGTQSYAALTTVPPPSVKASGYAPELQGISAGGQIAALRAKDKLTPNAANGSAYQCYEAEGGKLRLISVLPSGLASKGHCSIGTANAPGDLRRASVENAVSADGSHIFWTASSATFGPGQIYLRSKHKNPTIAVSEGGEALSGVAQASQFLTAASDGSKAIYAVGNLANGSAELYAFDTASKGTQLIAGGFRGILGSSEDASRIYLVSEEALGGEAQAGEPNLYLYEAGSGMSFIGAVSAADATAINPGFTPSAASLWPSMHLARVSPDGLHAAFMSTALLTGYDNTDAVSGKADAEVFLYDAVSEELRCASCNPTGARPTGRELAVRAQASGLWAAAQIPGWPTQLHASRVLAEDGSRLFFESYEALVPRDANGRQDVYQWEEPGSGNCTEGSPSYSPPNGGCLDLISSGRDPKDTRFLDASANGSDVFLVTGAPLVSWDTGLTDVYDARVNGGFPAPPARSAPCQGEACQSPASPPRVPTPASAGFRGPQGESSPAAPRCRKPKRVVRRGGKARCVKRGGKSRAEHREQRRSARH